MAEVWRNPKARKEPYQIEQFMPTEGKPPRKLTPKEMAEKVKAIHAAMGGKVKS